MLHHAGRKLTLWAQVLLIAGIAASVAAGFIVIWRGLSADSLRYAVYQNGYLYRTSMLGSGRVIISGILVMVFGSLGSWLTALLVKAFGDLAIDTKAIRRALEQASSAETTQSEPKSSAAQANAASDTAEDESTAYTEGE